MSLTFDQYAATRRHVDNLRDLIGSDDVAPTGYVYGDDGLDYIEDNATPLPGYPGKYYLLVDRSDWVSDDLAKLEKILWAYHYVWEEPDYVLWNDGNIDDFIQGWFAGLGRDIDGGVLSLYFSGAETWTPREAVDLIDEALRVYPDAFPRTV